MDFSDLETGPTISPSRSYRLQRNPRCFGRACSPMSPEQCIKNYCCETNIGRRRTGSYASHKFSGTATDRRCAMINYDLVVEKGFLARTLP
jgi:hypothetical protein